ncbi:MAG: hypothetical protein HY928_16785 [Elusimicrobia bacterium]|nr:hypothetical protein [Elusimicrobiota bacterium]
MRGRVIIRRAGVPDRSVWIFEGPVYVVGKAPGVEVSVPDEPDLGRHHLKVMMGGGKLHVNRLAEAPGPVLCDGAPQESFALEPGGSFMVGHTRFLFQAE